MKFSEYKYVRPNFDEMAQRLSEIATIIELSENITLIKELIDEANKIKSEFNTMGSLVYIRNSINTQDEFYEKEMEVLQEEENKIASSDNVLTKVLVNHKLRSSLEEIYGSYWFKKMELSLKVFDDCIIELLVKESKLTTEYGKLMASAQIEYNGEINNLSKMRKYLSDVDRSVRQTAAVKINDWIKENEAKLDDIYDQLVKLRHEMAIKLGYDNFVELGYARMGRTDYN